MSQWLKGLFCLILALPMVSAAEVNVLRGSSAYREGDSFVSELRFSRPVSAEQVSFEFINKTVQANIAGVTISQGKEHLKLEDDAVASVFTYQYEPQTMRSRIIHRSENVEGLAAQVRAEAAGNILKIIVDRGAGLGVDRATVAKIAPKAEPKIEAKPPVDLDKELQKALRLEVGAEAAVKETTPSADDAELIAAAAELESSEKSSEKTSDQIESEPLELSEMKAAESQIPLNLDVKKVKESESSPWARLLISLAVIAVVGGGLIVGVKRFSKDKTHVGGNIKVKIVSQHPLGPKKSLAVIHVAGESILIGITDHNISMIKSLALIDDELAGDLAPSFEQQMRQVGQVSQVNQIDRFTRTAALQSPAQEAPVVEDEFSISNIKDLVNSKLKEMRTL